MKLLIVAAGMIVALGGCAPQERATSSTTAPAQAKTVKSATAIDELAPPTGENSAEPFLSANGERLLLSWLEPVPGGDRVALRFAHYVGGEWTQPRTVIERNDLFVNWADFPSIVEDANGVMYAHWLQKSADSTYAYDVRMSTSRDAGATWREPFLLNRDGTKTEHGFASLAVLPGGGVGAAWLDGRKMKSGGGHDDHESAGDMTVRYATVDPSGSIANDAELDSRTCECCATGMALTAHGPAIVYRDRSSDEIRDVYFVRKTSGAWTAPKAVHPDGWKITGCPVNGPQIDAREQHAAVAWFTAAEDRGRVLLAFSTDDAATFSAPVQIDDGKPIGRVDVALIDAETALVSWLEQTTTGGELRARRVRRNGAPEASIKIADSSTARAAGFARMARVGRDVYFAWTEHDGKTKRIHVASRRFESDVNGSAR